MILCPWIFQHTSPKNKSHIPITMPWKGSIVHCLGTACVSSHFFSQLSQTYAFCVFLFHLGSIYILSIPDGDCVLHSSYQRYFFLLPLHSMESFAEMRPTVLQHSAHSGFVWFTCWWAFELFLVWGYWMLWVFLYELLSLCMLFISLGEMPWGGTTGSYAWYVYF